MITAFLAPLQGQARTERSSAAHAGDHFRATKIHCRRPKSPEQRSFSMATAGVPPSTGLPTAKNPTCQEPKICLHIGLGPAPAHHNPSSRRTETRPGGHRPDTTQPRSGPPVLRHPDSRRLNAASFSPRFSLRTNSAVISFTIPRPRAMTPTSTRAREFGDLSRGFWTVQSFGWAVTHASTSERSP